MNNPLESARTELYAAAIAFADTLKSEHDMDGYANSIIRLEVAAKAFADSESMDKARLDWIEEQYHEPQIGIDMVSVHNVRAYIDNQRKTPPSNHLDGAS